MANLKMTIMNYLPLGLAQELVSQKKKKKEEQNHSLREWRKAIVDSQQGNQIRPTHYLNVLI